MRLPARFAPVCVSVALAALAPFAVGTSRPAAQSRQTTTSKAAEPFRSYWPSASALGALETARAHLTEGALDDAFREFELSRDRAISARNTDVEGWAWHGLAGVAYRRSQFLVSRAANERALELFQMAADERGVAEVLLSLGVVAFDLGDKTLACTLWDRSEASFRLLADATGRVRALNNISYCPAARGAEALRQLLERARQTGDTLVLGRVLQRTGDFAYNEGDYNKALELYGEAEGLLGAAPDGKVEFSRLLTSQGRLLRALGYPRDAIPYYERALDLQQNGVDPTGVIQSLNSIGATNAYLGEHQKAADYYQRALRLAEDTSSPMLVDTLRGALATNAQRQGRHAEAVASLEAIIRRGADANLEDRYQAVVLSYLALGRIEDALAAGEAAVRLSATRGMENLLPATLARARARIAAGRTDEALGDLRDSLDMIDRMRSNLPAADLYKRGFAERTQQSFALAIDLQMRVGDAESALETSERARARAFLDLLVSRTVETSALTTTTASAPLAEATAEPVPTPAIVSPGATPLIGMRAAPGPLGGRGEVLIASAAATPAPSIAEVRALAHRLDTSIVSYWVLPEALFVWIVAPDGMVKSTRVPVDVARLSSLVTGVTKSDEGIATRGSETMAARVAVLPAAGETISLGRGAKSAAWSDLYALLIAPIESLLPATGSRLAILPHGPLLRLSFAALRDGRGRYLLERYRLQYAPSAGALAQLTAHARALDGTSRVLVVADPALPAARKGQPALAPLPAARSEARAIAALFPGRAAVLTGSNATRAAVREAAGSAGMLHFATHALVRDDQPFDSYLQLAGTAGAGSDDGRLRVSDIYNWRLPVDLVVLSACRSGQGAVTGDGMNGLARAFFSAGASSLVAAQWEIADEPSRAIMTRFFRELARGRSRDEALRTAQLAILQELRASRFTIDTPAGRFTLPDDPALWAGFVLIGAR